MEYLQKNISMKEDTIRDEIAKKLLAEDIVLNSLSNDNMLKGSKGNIDYTFFITTSYIHLEVSRRIYNSVRNTDCINLLNAKIPHGTYFLLKPDGCESNQKLVYKIDFHFSPFPGKDIDEITRLSVLIGNNLLSILDTPC